MRLIIDYFLDSLLVGFRPDLLEICDEVGSVRRIQGLGFYLALPVGSLAITLWKDQ